MQINPINNFNSYPTSSIKKNGTQNNDFASMLTNASPPTNNVKTNDKDCIVVHWNGEEMAAMCFSNGVNFAMYYTEESTEDNPIVLAKVVDADGKESEFEIKINEINPQNASFLEMKALIMHNSQIYSVQDQTHLFSIADSPDFNLFEKKDYIKVLSGDKEKAQNAGLIDISNFLSSFIDKLNTLYMEKFNEDSSDFIDHIL